MVVQNYYDVDPRVRREAECLVAEGYAVDVFALRNKGKDKVYNLNGVNVLTLLLIKKRTNPGRYIFESMFFFVWSFVLVTWRMLHQRYSVIQVHTVPDFLIFVGLIPKLLGSKVILDMHEVMPELYRSKYVISERHWMIGLLKWIESASIHFANHVIVVTQPIKDLLETRGFPPEKMSVVLNSADTELFMVCPSSVRNQNKPFVFMFHGTVSSLYGLDRAIRAFAMASADLNGAEFWIVGDGPERAKLEQLARELRLSKQVKFIGIIPHREIPDWLEQCDVGVIAARQDLYLDLAFFCKLPEYILSRKPAIAPRLHTTQYYFSDNAIAYFTPQDEAELVARMVDLYRSPELRHRLIDQAAYEYAAIDWSVMKLRYLQVIESLLYSQFLLDD